MNRALLAILPITLVVATACDHGTQARIIRTYRQAEFAAVSQSNVTRSSVTLTTTFELGLAYRVTSRRVEYVGAQADAEPPIDENGELIGPMVQRAEDEEEVVDSASSHAGGVLTVKFPSRLLRSDDLYYRWVVEYTNASGSTLDMRKSEIFRTTRNRLEPDAEDEKVTS